MLIKTDQLIMRFLKTDTITIDGNGRKYWISLNRVMDGKMFEHVLYTTTSQQRVTEVFEYIKETVTRYHHADDDYEAITLVNTQVKEQTGEARHGVSG